MPRVQLVLDVFVASPSDVKEEREALELVINELNKTLNKSSNIRLELNKWETDIYAGFGNDPQDVINKQVEDRYDIFIGILWGKIGTATPRAISGTLEEFTRAYTKYQQNSNSVQLMMYFKTAPISPENIIPEQFAQVKNFKKEVAELGGLYFTFNDSSDFQTTLRLQLNLFIQDWLKSLPEKHPEYSELLKIQKEKNKSFNFDTLNQQIEIYDEEEKGIFDYYEEIEKKVGEISESMKLISEATFNIGEQFKRRTDEIYLITANQNQSNTKEIGKIMEFTAAQMNIYTSELEKQIPIFSDARDEMFDLLSKILTLFNDFEDSEEGFKSMEEQLEQLNIGISTSESSLVEFRQQILSTPKLRSQLSRANKKVANSLSKMLTELNNTKILINNTQNVISQQRKI